MANMANTTIGKDWERRTFHLSFDEFRGCLVTISIQWNYWKTKSQKATSSSVDNSRNAEDPGRRRSNHLKSSRMVPLECAMVFRPEGNPPATKQAVEKESKWQ
ncbi:hypothetical protein Tco_0408339 [Tanacetum coccineum]